MDQTEALIWSFMWELYSSLVSLSNYDVFSSLAAPVPKSQKGQSPRPVSGAGLQLQGLLGALSSTLLPPQPWWERELALARVEPSAALTWAAARSLAPSSLSPQPLHSLLGSQRRLCAGKHPAALPPGQSGSWLGLALCSLGTLTDPACHF